MNAGFELKELKYLPFQKEGIEWMRGKSTALLADQMGLGKTVQAIGLFNTLDDRSKMLVICPASLKLNWRNELLKWCDKSCTIHIIDPSSPWIPADIVIVNYEQVQKHRAEIDRTEWTLLVCDESHYLKNSKAKRTHVVVGLWNDDPAKRIYPIKAARRVFMTGTPILNRPKELWTTVRALDRHGLGKDWIQFHIRYCDGYRGQHGWEIDGASNLEELQEKLRSSIMLRRKKDDVLKELPPKRRQIIRLEPVTAAAKKALEQEKELQETENEINTLRARVEALSVNQADKEYKEAAQKLTTLEATAFTETAKIRRQTAMAKLPMVLDHLVNVLESESKIVVFAYHHDMVDALVDGLAEYGAVSFDGRTDVAVRQAAVDLFQTRPEARVIIGSIGAMGTGWTLTAASYVAFTELDWVPGNMNQAEDRLHRIGQQNSILVQHLVLNGSFDGRMVQSVMRKQRVIERAVG